MTQSSFLGTRCAACVNRISTEYPCLFLLIYTNLLLFLEPPFSLPPLSPRTLLYHNGFGLAGLDFLYNIEMIVGFTSSNVHNIGVHRTAPAKCILSTRQSLVTQLLLTYFIYFDLDACRSKYLYETSWTFWFPGAWRDPLVEHNMEWILLKLYPPWQYLCVRGPCHDKDVQVLSRSSMLYSTVFLWSTVSVTTRATWFYPCNRLSKMNSKISTRHNG